MEKLQEAVLTLMERQQLLQRETDTLAAEIKHCVNHLAEKVDILKAKQLEHQQTYAQLLKVKTDLEKTLLVEQQQQQPSFQVGDMVLCLEKGGCRTEAKIVQTEMSIDFGGHERYLVQYHHTGAIKWLAAESMQLLKKEEWETLAAQVGFKRAPPEHQFRIGQLVHVFDPFPSKGGKEARKWEGTITFLSLPSSSHQSVGVLVPEYERLRPSPETQSGVRYSFLINPSHLALRDLA